jgi:hypothetical protein
MWQFRSRPVLQEKGDGQRGRRSRGQDRPHTVPPAVPAIEYPEMIRSSGSKPGAINMPPMTM